MKLQIRPFFAVNFSDFPLPSGWIMEHTMRRSSLKSRITRITRLARSGRNLSTMDEKTSSNQSLIIKIEFIIPPFLLDFPMNSYMDDMFFSSAIRCRGIRGPNSTRTMRKPRKRRV